MQADLAETIACSYAHCPISTAFSNYSRPKLPFRRTWIPTGPGITRIQMIRPRSAEPFLEKPACEEMAHKIPPPIPSLPPGRFGLGKLCALRLPENPECGVLPTITPPVRATLQPGTVHASPTSRSATSPRTVSFSFLAAIGIGVWAPILSLASLAAPPEVDAARMVSLWN